MVAEDQPSDNARPWHHPGARRRGGSTTDPAIAGPHRKRFTRG
jgi:hypothetical protein